MKSVQIKNRDMAWHIAANILFPPNFDENKQYPTIVSVHPFGSCKEQTSGNVYGKALAEQGFVVIPYDASFQGASGGEPRWIEDPTQRVEDISHVIDYAVTLPYADADRIGVIGVCGGGGYVLNATLTEKRIKAVVAITPVNIGRLFREGFSNYDPLGALDAMAAQRTKEARGGELQVNELLPASPDVAKANGLTERDVFEATDYYKTSRGQQPGGCLRGNADDPAGHGRDRPEGRRVRRVSRQHGNLWPLHGLEGSPARVAGRLVALRSLRQARTRASGAGKAGTVLQDASEWCGRKPAPGGGISALFSTERRRFLAPLRAICEDRK
jgi:fermentation-respiration switch protein FrsA (DUF1100 family)